MVSRNELFGPVINAIHELREPYKTILTMRILEAKTFEEIAAKVGKHVETIKNIYYRETASIMKKVGIPGF